MEQNQLQMDVLLPGDSRIEADYCGRASSIREGRGSFSDTLERFVSVDPGKPSIIHKPLAAAPTAAGVTKSVAAGASLDSKDTAIQSSVTERPHISLWQV